MELNEDLEELSIGFEQNTATVRRRRQKRRAPLQHRVEIRCHFTFEGCVSSSFHSLTEVHPENYKLARISTGVFQFMSEPTKSCFLRRLAGFTPAGLESANSLSSFPHENICIYRELTT